MRSNEKILLYGGLAAAAYILFSKGRALANLVFSPGTVNNIGFVNGIPVADFTVLVQNTSTASLTINSFAGNVFANNTLVGNVFNFSPIDVPGNTMVPANITIQFKALGIVNDLIRSFQYNNFFQSVTIDGYANVSGLQLPIHLNFGFGNPANGPI